jgi:hypothetical protein
MVSKVIFVLLKHDKKLKENAGCPGFLRKLGPFS